MTIYRVDVPVYATIYVKADDARQALERMQEASDCLTVETGNTPDDWIITDMRLDDPELPIVSLSPVMTMRLDNLTKKDFEIAE